MASSQKQTKRPDSHETLTEGEPAPLRPYAIYEALEAIQPGINKGQTLRDAKSMIEHNFTLEEIVACARWLQTEDDWHVANAVPINSTTVLRKLPAWRIAHAKRPTPRSADEVDVVIDDNDKGVFL